MNIVNDVFKVPKGIDVPCVVLPDLFQGEIFEPDVVDWLKSSPVERERVAGEKDEAERVAVKACHQCPLMGECREWFTGKDVFGVVGGETKRERVRKVAQMSGAPPRGGTSWDPIDHYLETGYLVSIYEYVNKLAKKDKMNFIEIANTLGISEGEVLDVLKVNEKIDPHLKVRNEQKWVRKLIAEKVPGRLIVERLGVSEYFYRSVRKGDKKSRRKKIENAVEAEHGMRWARFARPTKLVYDFLAVRKKFDKGGDGGETGVEDVNLSRFEKLRTCSCPESVWVREEIFQNIHPLLTKQDKLNSVQKGRVFKTHDAKLVSGARRAVNHALLLGVNNGMVTKVNFNPCGETSCSFVVKSEETVEDFSPVAAVEGFTFDESFANKWYTYRYKKLLKMVD